ncbi:MAG: DNA translocase FtsK [Ruminococcus sp.]
MAQKKSTKKRTATQSKGRSSTANSKRKTSSSKGSAETVQSGGMNPQVKAILLLASAVLLLALVIFKGEHFWSNLRGFMYGVFGFGFVLIPFLLGYLAIMTAKEKRISRLTAKLLLSAFIIILVSSLFFLFGKGDYKEASFFGAMGLSYKDSFETADGVGGGIISCILGYPLVKLCGDNFLPKFIVILLLIVSILLLTGISLVDIANVAKKQMSYLRHPRRNMVLPDDEEYAEELPAHTEKPRNKHGASRIDIPLATDSKKSKEKEFAEPDDVLTNDDSAAAQSDASDKLINSILIANEEYTGEDESKASILAREITRQKGKERMTEGAKQPDPETVSVDPEETPVDIDKETACVEDEVKKAETNRSVPRYTFPPVRLLRQSFDSNDEDAMRELQDNATKLIDTLKSFGVEVSISNICRGPSVTRYELKPAPGVKINKITNLADDIALSLAAEGVRIEAPIPGKSAVGIEVPNKYVSSVSMRELIESSEFRNAKSKLTCVLGKDISGNIVTADLAAMPHLLIAGTTGSGKSVCVNSLLMSILFRATPDEVKLLLIDPKMVEFSKYKGLPHLLIPVVSDAKKAAGALNWAVTEMMQRYKMFSEYDCKDINSFNSLVESNQKYIEENEGSEEEVCMEINGLPVPTEKMPRIVVAIDEFADLMMVAAKEVEDAICRLAQMARAAGMHLVIATQRPTVNVITGLIKANIPSRIALKVSSFVDSKTILDFGGAENLIGKGDMLFSPIGSSKPQRVQGCYASDAEIEGVTDYIKKQHRAQYNEEVEEKIRRIAAEELGKKGKDTSDDDDSDGAFDDKIEEAIKCVVDAGQASTSLLQRRLKVGYARAGRMIDDLERMGVVGPYNGAKPREVLITYQDWLERNNITD